MKEPPVLEIGPVPSSYRVKRGDSVTITVNFKALPPPKVEWCRNGVVIKPSKNIDIKTTDTSTEVTIKNVQEEDGVLYTIQLANSAGEANGCTSVIVIGTIH